MATKTKKTKPEAVNSFIDFSDIKTVLDLVEWKDVINESGKMILGLDLETVPPMDTYPELLDLPTNDEIQEALILRIPKGYKKPETKMKWIEDNRDTFREKMLSGREEENQKLISSWKKGALDSHLGKVIVIGFAIPGHPPLSLHVGGELETEEELILAFDWVLDYLYTKCAKIVAMGHNVKGFDAVWLARLAVKYRAHYLMKFVSLISPIDTCEMWQMTSRDFKARKGLDAIAEYLGFGGKLILDDEVCDVLGLPPGSTMHGSLVCDLYRCGAIELLRRYCEGDVSVTRAIYERIQTVKGYARSRVA